MKTDITLLVTPKMAKDAQENLKKALTGHLGTHFDVMNKTFPLEYTELEGIVFDIKDNGQGETMPDDIDLSLVKPGMFVAFHSGFIEQEGYGGAGYFKEHPQLSMEVIHQLIEKKISIIGIDFAGVRCGKEHTPTDQLCADHGVFIIENLYNLGKILNGKPYATFHAHTYPMNFSNMTGLPCRVVADV